MQRYLPIAAAVVVLLFSGLVHGIWTDRWGDPKILEDAVARLHDFPIKAGEWQGQDLDIKKGSHGLAGSVSLRYVHRTTGKAVTVFLGTGRRGPVSIHTPDVCYAASGFKGEGKRTYTFAADSPAAGATFYHDTMRKARAADNTQLRIFWSWNAGGTWQTAENPRFAFVGQSILYKVYFIREVGTPPEPPESDPCLDLMSHLLPQLQRAVLTTS
jgi:hypothetical protein